MPVLMRVPIAERDVFGCDLDEAGSGLSEPPGQQAPQAKSAGIVDGRLLRRFLRKIESRARGRCQQTPRIFHRTREGLHVISAAVLQHRTRADKLAITPETFLEARRIY